MVWYNVVLVGELFMADCAYSLLFADLPLQKFLHFGWGSEFSISPRMMRIVNASNAGLQVCEHNAFLPDRNGEVIYEWDSIRSSGVLYTDTSEMDALTNGHNMPLIRTDRVKRLINAYYNEYI